MPMLIGMFIMWAGEKKLCNISTEKGDKMRISRKNMKQKFFLLYKKICKDMKKWLKC